MSGRFKVGEKLVSGVGYNDGTYPAVKTKEHALWRSMLSRCYTERNLLLKPAYRVVVFLIILKSILTSTSGATTKKVLKYLMNTTECSLWTKIY